jgi:hypothetical protein
LKAAVQTAPTRTVLSRRTALAAITVLALTGCQTYYPVSPAAYGPSTFDRAFDAALGAIGDQGLRITSQDRASGNIVGVSGTVSVTASVRPQADGTTRVEFKTAGAADAGLAQRVAAAYNARMGR